MKASSFFRWKPAAVFLWLFAIIFGLFGVLNVALARLASLGRLPHPVIQNPSKMARSFIIGAIENIAITTLFIFAWYLMRRRTPITLLVGVVPVWVGLLISVVRWLH